MYPDIRYIKLSGFFGHFHYYQGVVEYRCFRPILMPYIIYQFHICVLSSEFHNRKMSFAKNAQIIEVIVAALSSSSFLQGLSLVAPAILVPQPVAQKYWAA